MRRSLLGPQFPLPGAASLAAALAFSWASSRSFSRRLSRFSTFGASVGLGAGAAATGAGAAAGLGLGGSGTSIRIWPEPRLWTIGSPSWVTTTWQNRFWWLPAGETLSVFT